MPQQWQKQNKFQLKLYLRYVQIREKNGSGAYFNIIQMHTSCDCTKSLLSSSIPNLQLDSSPIKLDSPYLEINAEWYSSIIHTGRRTLKGNTIVTNLNLKESYPMVVMKLVVKEPSEKRRRRQLLPTPDKASISKNFNANHCKWPLQTIQVNLPNAESNT